MSRKYKINLIWIGLAIFSIVLKVISSDYPQFVETFYSRGLFLAIRWSIDYIIGWIPIPLIYLFFTVIIIWTFFTLRKIIKSESKWYKKIFETIFSFVTFTSALIFFFFFLWGYNYNRIPIEQQLQLDAKPLTLDELREELLWATEEVVEMRNKLSLYYSENPYELELPENTEKELRQSLETWLDQNGYPTVGRVRGRWLYPKGIFLRFSSAGLYFPFTAEGHIDAGMHELQHPATMAHELGHGYGFGDEGTCNFLSLMACHTTDNIFLKYSGYLDYWQTVAYNYRRYDREGFVAIRNEKLSDACKKDLEAIGATLRKYPDLMPRVRNAAYNTYLKSQGIKEGILYCN
ncbi:MAG: DUF3810 family protein [Bacteroidota bacterium]